MILLENICYLTFTLVKLKNKVFLFHLMCPYLLLINGLVIRAMRLKILLGEVNTLISSSVVIDKKNNQRNFPVGPILISAKFWCSQGLDHFEKCGDTRNVTLLRCNLCQCY